ncbi:TRAP transporter small permease [Rhodococcus sp. B50]|uniref:TRAP transporter small permease n=1 Tax=Rhodococcus sp. B50 TaxID=2682847 RepID=UPI001BD38AE2|nr:TRAP transporter small permease [Rhodococcus sp. B50]MBS9376091.1 hypothetical protein [Rhodococcus sp. B50]
MKSRMIGPLRRVSSQALEAVAAITLMVMMLHVVANALMRSFANQPITGTNEYVGYWYLPAVAFIGFVVAQRRGDHIEARVLFDRLPSINKRELDVLGLLLAAVAYSAFAWFGWLEALDNRAIAATGGVTGVVIWPVTFIVPFSFMALAVLVITEAVAQVREARDPAAQLDLAGPGPTEPHYKTPDEEPVS